jgi:hypothetical protein
LCLEAKILVRPIIPQPPNVRGLATTRAAMKELLRCINTFKLRAGVIELDAERKKFDVAIKKIREGIEELEDIRFKSDEVDGYPSGG